MTDDAHSPHQPPSQWSGQQSDGTRAWGTPTHSHDPQHTEWSYDRGAGYGYPSPYPYGAPMPPYPQQSARKSGRRSAYIAAGAALVAAAATAFGFVAAGSPTSTVNGSGSLFPSVQGGGSSSNGGSSGGSSSGGSSGGTVPGGTLPGGGSTNGGGTGSGTLPGGGTGSPTSVSVATAKQAQGVVTIVSVLKYQNAESAGTGMILSSDGEILTNNHVINGATSITATDETTGKSYRADVVGTDASDDVAVIKLRDASGLTKANIGDSEDVSMGDAVVGVGNAGGTGTLRASNGKVTALNQTITATDESGQAGERLHGLIEVNAPIISGDSGGPMYDSKGEIVGMNTAASQSRTAQKQAYAIPIDNAVSIADKIESGVTTSTIKQGVPGFLGVTVADSSSGGAAIASILQDGPADRAGIVAGSVITSVDGKKTTSADGLKKVMSGVKPGSNVRVTWTGPDGATHSANVTPIKGPAA